ncbi:MAG: SpoIIE family protein phosphatase [Campylobacterota bacterium]|nr:SpoIIE family protein phosphatase [Campylobacterota bacterium]
MINTIAVKEENVIKKLQDKEQYNSYQEELGFAKELNILRNDFYYQMIDYKGVSLVDFLYQPLDVMSGDAYSARQIDKHCTFYLMIDGMGKGMSASLTAMIMTSFVNHMIDKMIFLDNFDLGILIHETMEYIKPILLDEESLAIDYIVVNYQDNMLYYAKFAMPVLLMQTTKDEIVRLKSNNPPLSKWQPTFNIDAVDISEITKLLIYSDGIVENDTIFENKPYSEFIEKDFLNSFTKKDFKNSFFQKITTQDDDITLIYIHRLNNVSTKISHRKFSSTLQEIDNANIWYTQLLEGLTDEVEISNPVSISFTELFLNAHEHGNLGIDSKLKHHLIDQDRYLDTLLEKEKDCTKTISVKVDKIQHGSVNYMITQITDDGDGFDTQILSEIFRNSKMYNGRGVFVSRKNSLGIYYNTKGNSVLFLNKI